MSKTLTPGQLRALGRKPVLTTGEVASLSGLSCRTVCLWLNKGYLTGYRLPGPRGRRMLYREGLVAMLARHGMPLGALADPPGERVVLAVGLDAATAGRIAGPPVRLLAAADGFSAARLVAAHRPDCVVIDTAVGQSESLRMAALVRGDLPDCRVILVAGEDADLAGTETSAYGIDFVMGRPFDPARLAALAAGGAGA